MPVKFHRRFLLISALLALPPVFGSAGAFDELAPGYSLSAALPVPAPAVYADESRAASSGHYLSLDGLDLTGVPPAPAGGSAQDREDFRTLLDWQVRRTGEQCAAAKAEMEHSYTVFFGKISPFDSPAPAPVAAFFNNVAGDSVAAHKYLKDVYRRERPFVRDPRIKPCLPRVKGFAYPSGHAAMARLFALILSGLEPARKKEFMARADEAALNRVLSGAHHPTDVEAGKALAGALYKSLLKEPAFKADLKAVRAFLN